MVNAGVQVTPGPAGYEFPNALLPPVFSPNAVKFSNSRLVRLSEDNLDIGAFEYISSLAIDDASAFTTSPMGVFRNMYLVNGRKLMPRRQGATAVNWLTTQGSN